MVPRKYGQFEGMQASNRITWMYYIRKCVYFTEVLWNRSILLLQLEASLYIVVQVSNDVRRGFYPLGSRVDNSGSNHQETQLKLLQVSPIHLKRHSVQSALGHCSQLYENARINPTCVS